MHPGGDCVGCHAQRGGKAPSLALAGTVMGDLKDETDCGGIADVIVEVTDAKHNVHTMKTNAAGNFLLRTPAVPLSMPFTVKLSLGGKERVMMTPQSDGSCVTCHTPEGKNGAPGRILAPM
jgi:mono/diheme cytochrome c family protein